MHQVLQRLYLAHGPFSRYEAFVRKLTSRHALFLIGRAATWVFPSLQARTPFYDAVLPMIEAGRAEVFTEVQPVTLHAEAAGFPHKLPESVERSVALIALDDVTVLGSTGVVVDERGGKLLRPRGILDGIGHHDFLPIPSKAVRKPHANYFNMMGSRRGYGHFFHFMFERLPRLYYLLHRFDLGRQPVTVLTNPDLPDFQRDIFRFVGERFANVRFEAVPRNEHWQVERLYHLDDYQPIKRTLADPAMLGFLRSLVFDGFGLTAPQHRRRVYVTRSDTKRRRIVNDGQIMRIFERHGFEPVAPGTLPFRDQVALFMGADAVAGPHGAGLTNLLFAPNQARVLELFPADRVKNTYLLLSHCLGQTYRAVIGGMGNRREHFEIDPAQVEIALDRLLAAPTANAAIDGAAKSRVAGRS